MLSNKCFHFKLQAVPFKVCLAYFWLIINSALTRMECCQQQIIPKTLETHVATSVMVICAF